MRQFFRIFCIFLPIALFVMVLFKVRDFFDEGAALSGVGVMLGALVVLAVWEGVMFRFWLLPAWGRVISERVYGGSYTPDQDPLVALAARIREGHERELLPQLEQLVREDSRRARAWAELASVYTDEFHDNSAALKALLDGAEHVSGKEDRALFLCRAALMCEQRLHDRSHARELYEKAASKYPRTAYGRRAAEALSRL